MRNFNPEINDTLDQYVDLRVT